MSYGDFDICDECLFGEDGPSDICDECELGDCFQPATEDRSRFIPGLDADQTLIPIFSYKEAA